MTKPWPTFQQEIKRAYIEERMSLVQVRSFMKQKYGFEASERAYKLKLEEWGYWKYHTQKLARTFSQIETADNIASGSVTRPKLDLAIDKDSWSLRHSGQEVVRRQSTQFGQLLPYESQAIEQHQSALVKRGKSANKRYQNDDSKEHETSSKRHKITSDKQISMEIVLAALILQWSRPTGFASCWKERPMELEDAHGGQLIFPVEVVTTREIFDEMMFAYFRGMPGFRKVQAREYRLTDSTSGTVLPEDLSWSTICKAGRRFKMQMDFLIRGQYKKCSKCGVVKFSVQTKRKRERKILDELVSFQKEVDLPSMFKSVEFTLPIECTCDRKNRKKWAESGLFVELTLLP